MDHEFFIGFLRMLIPRAPDLRNDFEGERLN